METFPDFYNGLSKPMVATIVEGSIVEIRVTRTWVMEVKVTHTCVFEVSDTHLCI